MPHTYMSSPPLYQCLIVKSLSIKSQFQCIQDLLRHLPILPHPASHLLELDTMQGEQRHLDDEDFKSQDHVLARIALHVCCGFAHYPFSNHHVLITAAAAAAARGDIFI